MMKKLFILFSIFHFLFSHEASAAMLFSQAANQDTYVGQTFVLDWYLDSEKQPINAIDLGLSFSPETLEVADISSGSSLVNLWIKNPSFDNASGKISLTGGIANGVVGDKVPIFRVSFRAKAPGTAYIKLDQSSQVLLNDGAGTSETLKFREETFNVYPANFIPLQIFSTTHPNPDAWYSNRNVKIGFSPKDGYDYSYSFSSNAEIIPDETVDAVSGEISYENMPDGVYYFKVNSKHGSDAWQEAGVFRVQIDATAPEDFTPLIGSDPGISNGNKFVSFSTLDKMSGISHYYIKFGWFGGSETKDSQYILPKFTIGNKITITAFDNAGNQRTETVNSDSGSPSIVLYGLGLIVIGSLIFYFRKDLLKRFRKSKQDENKIENQKIDQNR